MDKEDLDNMVYILKDYWPKEINYFNRAYDFLINSSNNIFAKRELLTHIQFKFEYMNKEITGEYHYEYPDTSN